MKKLALVLALAGCVTVPQDVGYGRFAHVYTGSGNLIIQIDHPSGYECENDVKGNWAHIVELQMKARCDDQDQRARMSTYIDIKDQTGPVAATRIWYLDEEMCIQDLPTHIKQARSTRNGTIVPECKHT